MAERVGWMFAEVSSKTGEMVEAVVMAMLTKGMRDDDSGAVASRTPTIEFGRGQRRTHSEQMDERCPTEIKVLILGAEPQGESLSLSA